MKKVLLIIIVALVVIATGTTTWILQDKPKQRNAKAI